MRPVRSVLSVLAAGAIVFGGASAASADVTVTGPAENSFTIVFGDWYQFAADDVFNAGHDNTVGSNN
ncbi:chaplin [Streptomyces sp. cmx-4-9]|uniref:chaplin n=1 Tax=Streptomyces sp. cmx-4-9 TaxID=2790941 RepID=UPI00397F47A0